MLQVTQKGNLPEECNLAHNSTLLQNSARISPLQPIFYSFYKPCIIRQHFLYFVWSIWILFSFDQMILSTNLKVRKTLALEVIDYRKTIKSSPVVFSQAFSVCLCHTHLLKHYRFWIAFCQVPKQSFCPVHNVYLWNSGAALISDVLNPVCCLLFCKSPYTGGSGGPTEHTWDRREVLNK